MEVIKKIFAWILAHKKIVISISVAIAILILGIVFGAKIQGCIYKVHDANIEDTRDGSLFPEQVGAKVK